MLKKLLNFEIIKICFINDFMLKWFLHELYNGTYCVCNKIVIDCKNHQVVDKNHLTFASLQMYPTIARY